MNRFSFVPAFLAASLFFIALPEQASGELEMWVRIEGENTAGESQDEGRKDWIDILAWSWGGSNSGSFHFGGGGGGGKPSIQDLTFTKYLDKSSPGLLQAAASGRPLPTVWLDVARGEGGTVVERLALRNVLVSSVNMSVAANDGIPTESISLHFAKIEKGYLLPGGFGSEPDHVETFAYDIPKNVASTFKHLPVLNDGDRDGKDDVEDHDRDNNGIGDAIEDLPLAPSPEQAGITGFVWRDDDADGVRDTDEVAAIGSRVELYPEGAVRPIQSRQVNEASGQYAFLNLAPGGYKVRFVPAVGFQFGTQTGESVADPTTGFSPTVAIAGGTNLVRSAAILSDEDAYSEFAFADFSQNGDDLFHSGDASVIEDVITGLPILQLTPEFPQITGSTFYNRSVVAATFTTQFQFRMRGNGLRGEGFTFVVRDPDNRSPESFLAAGGGGLGYAGMDQSFAVEFDTFPSGSPDPTQAHVGILLNGDLANNPGSTAETAGLGNINDGEIWNVWIDYDGTEVEVFLSKTPAKPGQPLVSRAITWPARRAFVGFTAATFSATQAHEILSWNYEGGQNNTLVIAPATSQAELDAVTKAPGSIVIEGDDRSSLSMTSLTTVCGDLIIRNNANLQTISLPNLVEVFGDVLIEENALLTSVDVPFLRDVTGDVRISTDATITSDLREVQSENVSVVGVALETFMGKTGYRETKVEIRDDATKMELNIPEGAFTVPETFEIDQITGTDLDDLVTGALDSEGAAVDVVPVLGFDYSFAGGGINLNKEVEIQFEIDLDSLPAANRTNVLNAFDSGTLTVFGSRSEDTPVEVFAVCDVLDFGVWDNCARARALDSEGEVVASFAASTLEFTVFARHFSTYGVAVIEPIAIPQAELDRAARRIASSVQLVPLDEEASPQTYTLQWTSYSVATSADGARIHPTNRIEISTDLETWTPAGEARGIQLLESETNTRTTTLIAPDGASSFFFRIGVGE